MSRKPETVVALRVPITAAELSAVRKQAASSGLGLMAFARCGLGLDASPPVMAVWSDDRDDKSVAEADGGWTEARADALRRRREAGESVGQIADALSVSERRVYQMLGVEQVKPRVTDEQRAEVMRLVRSEVPQRQIAERLGLGRNTVGRVIVAAERAAQLPPAKPRGAGPVPDDIKRHILERSAAGREPSTIAREIDLPTSTVRGVIKRAAKS